MMNNTAKTIICTALVGLALTPAWGRGPADMRKASGTPTPPPPETTICGIMVSNDEWNGDLSQAGVYTVEVRPEGRISCIHRSQEMGNTAAALMHNNIMYTVSASNEGFFFNKYSGSTWARTSREEIDVQNVPSDLTYDPKTGKVYGGFWDEEYNGFSRFCSFGLSDAEAKEVTGLWDERDFFTTAATPDGTIYSLYGSYNSLATVDVSNRKAETPIVNRIKTTGLHPKANVNARIVNSMTYDAANDRLIAIVFESEGYGASKVETSSLYTIDPKTAVPTLIRRMPGNACMAGIYVMEAATNPMAPLAPTGVAVVPGSNDITQGTLSFSVPSKTFGGAALTENVMAIVTVNGAESVHGYYQAGQAVEIPVTLVNGDNTVTVQLATDNYRGEKVEKTLYAGYDSPMPVTNVRVSVDAGAATVSWDAPTAGANGGVINQNDLRYTVTRFPDNKIVATDYGSTSFTDSNLPSVRAIYYSVLVYNDIAPAANSVESNHVPVTGAFEVPFTETFDSADDFALWTVTDLSGDKTWTFNASNKCADYTDMMDKTPGDDWLFSPAINLTEGKVYKVSYDFRVLNSRYPETFEVKAGMGLTPQDMTVAVDAHNGATNTSFSPSEAIFTATSTGKWYLGVHYMSEARMVGMYIDNVKVEEFDSRVPAAVGNLTATPGAQGELNATVAFTVPDKDANGEALNSVSKVEVYREDVSTTSPVKTFTDITPGQALSYKDQVAKAGIYNYIVRAFNMNEGGVAASVRVFIGEDVPGVPGKLTVTDDGTHPVVSWQASSKGDNGGWYDLGKTTYTVYRNGAKVAENLSETTFTDATYTIPTNRQDAITYIVIACYNGKTARGAQTDAVVVGASYVAPATETFPEADFDYYPWLAQSSMAPTYGWTTETSGVSPVVPDHSGNRGLACFHAVGETEGMTVHFYSPKFDISALENPTLSFYMYHTPSVVGEGTLQVSVSTDGGEFVALGSPIARAEGETDGWVRHSFDLGAYKGATALRVCFTGVGDAAANIFIDDIKFDNMRSRDAEVAAIAAPIRVAAGQHFPVEVKIENLGQEALTGLSLTLKDGSDILSSKSDISLAANSGEILILDVTVSAIGTHELSATLSGDGYEDNNTASATVKIVEPVLPTVSGLTTTVNESSVTLSWLAPHEAGHVTDNVDSYKDWAIDGIGEWTMFDGEYAPTVYINGNLGAYPNAQARKAFQVCNASTLGIDQWEEGKPHSGNKMFMAVASMGYVNNDWLISPRLNGAEQWISFFARSFTLDGINPERMKVWYSTTDTDPVNFIALTDNYIELGGTWVEYRYYLPEGARYFAINCVSDDSFAMFVDDLTFNDMSVPVWKLTGYEVTCNGETVATVTEPTFTHEQGGGLYAVRPIFEQGNGAYCEGVKVEVSGLSAVTSGFEVTTIPGAIVVTGTESDVTITAPDGTSFTTSVGTIPASPGIYLVTVEATTVKVVVK